MTTYTKVQLRNEVLENLGVLGAGGTADSEDAAKVERAIQVVYEWLEDEGLMPFDPNAASTTSVIPARIFFALADLVESYTAKSFGKAVNYDERRDAERRVRRAMFRPSAGSTPIVEY